MPKLLFFDCFAGISGDMTLAALIDLGADQARLRAELSKLPLGSWKIDVTRDSRKGISGTQVKVVLPDTREAVHEHPHRTFRTIQQMIVESALAEKVKKTSLAVFTRLAEAEAKIHGHAIDEVAFHEVGAVDSIVDIVGTAVCLDDLKVERIVATPVQVGGGFVTCAHGVLPVPAPATVELLKGAPIRTGIVPFETTTPTGAAILAATVNHFTERLDFTPTAIGYGIGMRDLDIPNVLRVFLCESGAALADDDLETGQACLIETNIDDMSPEAYEAIIETLFARGAQDVYLTPIIMKKSRPAVKISILCEAPRIAALEEVLWLHTTTFGLRRHNVTKRMLRRDISEVDTPFGAIPVKNAYWRGRRIKSKPEYEVCKKLAHEKGVSIREVLCAIQPAPDKETP